MGAEGQGRLCRPCIYTQTTDVETECNGLLTYDRAVIKVTAGARRRGEPASCRRRP